MRRHHRHYHHHHQHLDDTTDSGQMFEMPFRMITAVSSGWLTAAKSTQARTKRRSEEKTEEGERRKAQGKSSFFLMTTRSLEMEEWTPI